MPNLGPEEVRALLRRAQAGDRAARDALVEANLGLVKAVAQRYVNKAALPFDDLFQLGCVGLLKAISGFNLDYSVRFSTYAVPMIAGEIRRAMRDDGMVRVSRSLKELAGRISAATQRLSASLGRAPALTEIAADLGVSVYDVVEALDAGRGVGSLDEPMGDDDGGASLGDFVADAQEDWADSLWIRQMIEGLEARERQVIVMRYFLDLTQNEVAKRMGISQVQVSRLEARVIKRMRERSG